MIDPEAFAAERARLRDLQAGTALRADDRRRMLARLRSDRDSVARIAADENLPEGVVRAAIAEQLVEQGSTSALEQLEAAAASVGGAALRGRAECSTTTTSTMRVGGAAGRHAIATTPAARSPAAHVCTGEHRATKAIRGARQ